MEIRIEHLSYIYGEGTAYEKKALDDIDLTIHEGEFIGIIGHTGSGKSTLVQHLNGLNKATRGKIYVDGKNIYGEGYPMRELRFRVGLVFQYPEYQLFETTVMKDVCFGPKNQGLSEEEAKARARKAMEMVGLDQSYEEKSPFELSGGQKRRVAIAGILAMDPETLVLDEPTAGLDPKGREEILNVLRDLHRTSHITVVLVSHSMEDVADYASRIVVLDKGRILYDDVPARVFCHVKELEEVGLAAPQVTYIMKSLKEKGWDVKDNVTTLDEAAQQILAALKASGWTESQGRAEQSGTDEPAMKAQSGKDEPGMTAQSGKDGPGTTAQSGTDRPEITVQDIAGGKAGEEQC